MAEMVKLWMTVRIRRDPVRMSPGVQKMAEKRALFYYRRCIQSNQQPTLKGYDAFLENILRCPWTQFMVDVVKESSHYNAAEKADVLDYNAYYMREFQYTNRAWVDEVEPLEVAQLFVTHWSRITHTVLNLIKDDPLEVKAIVARWLEMGNVVDWRVADPRTTNTKN